MKLNNKVYVQATFVKDLPVDVVEFFTGFRFGEDSRSGLDRCIPMMVPFFPNDPASKVMYSFKEYTDCYVLSFCTICDADVDTVIDSLLTPLGAWLILTDLEPMCLLLPDDVLTDEMYAIFIDDGAAIITNWNLPFTGEDVTLADARMLEPTDITIRAAHQLFLELLSCQSDEERDDAFTRAYHRSCMT